jgi:antitoxin component of MazEF toxin-antitoxin module
MVTKIQKWGNSQGLRLARQVLEDAHISVGDDVDVTARDGRLEGQAIVIKYFFLLRLLQPILAPRIIRTSMTANNILFLNQQKKQF